MSVNIKSSAIIYVNCATCNYLGYNYAYIMTRVLQYLQVAHGKFVFCNEFAQSVFMCLDRVKLLRCISITIYRNIIM